MKKGEKCIWARPGEVPVTGVIAKVSKAGKWVEVSADKLVWGAANRVLLPDPFFFTQEEVEK